MRLFSTAVTHALTYSFMDSISIRIRFSHNTEFISRLQVSISSSVGSMSPYHTSSVERAPIQP